MSEKTSSDAALETAPVAGAPKAESLSLHGEVGIAPRAERLLVLTVGLALTGLDGGVAPGARGQLWLALALGIVFLTASITAVQRTAHVRTQLRKEE